jgi:Domain of unknown function (DUF4303)
VPSIDWKTVERAVYDGALAAITKLMERQPASFYAGAFHEFYAERGGVIAMPCLAANTVEYLEGKDEARWSSADWKWTQIKYANAETRKLHRAIEKAARSGDESLWQKTYERFIDMFVAVAKKLTAQLRKRPRAAKDFGVFVFNEENEVDVLKRCMTPARFKKLFPQLQAKLEAAKQRDKSPIDSKLKVYRQELRAYENEILKLGAQALPMLLDALHDENQGWAAADILAKIGIPDPEILRVLKQHALKGNELAVHDTIALALLGEVDFLLELADSAKTRDVAVQGICILYSAWLNWCERPPALDYRPLEQLLEKPGCKGKVKRLNSGSCATEADVKEALRGIESKHAAIREHAVSVLGDRRLGVKAAIRILPALAARLQDRNATVRRLAIISLSGWKKTAKPYAAEIRKLFKDPDADVAFTAKHYWKEMS